MYKEILRLKEMLEEAKIPFNFREWDGGYQIGYPVLPPNRECICDAIETNHSYGRDQDLLEIMGLLTPEEKEYDDVIGYLTAEDVFNRINNHYKNIK